MELSLFTKLFCPLLFLHFLTFNLMAQVEKLNLVLTTILLIDSKARNQTWRLGSDHSLHDFLYLMLFFLQIQDLPSSLFILKKKNLGSSTWECIAFGGLVRKDSRQEAWEILRIDCSYFKEHVQWDKSCQPKKREITYTTSYFYFLKMFLRFILP